MKQETLDSRTKGEALPPIPQPNDLMPRDQYHSTHEMKDTSMDVFSKMVETGDKLARKDLVLGYVIKHPDLTAKELVREMVKDGHFAFNDGNLARPRLTELQDELKIFTPYKRVCAVTSEYAYVYRSAQVKYLLTIESRSEPGTNNVTIYYTDGTIHCTCKGRRIHGHCHHAEGMLLMVEGKRINLEAKE